MLRKKYYNIYSISRLQINLGKSELIQILCLQKYVTMRKKFIPPTIKMAINKFFDVFFRHWLLKMGIIFDRQ